MGEGEGVNEGIGMGVDEDEDKKPGLDLLGMGKDDPYVAGERVGMGIPIDGKYVGSNEGVPC